MATTKIIITWNTDRKDEPKEETRLILDREFDKLHHIEKLDFLKDAVWELGKIYDGLLSSLNQGMVS